MGSSNGARASRDGFRLSLRVKILAVIGTSVALVVVILVGTLSWRMRDLMTHELRKRGEAVTAGLATNLAFALFSDDRVGLGAAAAGTVRDISDAAYVVLRNARGEVVASKVHPAFEGLPLERRAAPGSEARAETVQLGGHSFLEASAPALFEESAPSADPFDPMGLLQTEPKAPTGARKAVGSVQVGLRLDRLESEIATQLRQALTLGLVVLLGSIGAGLVLARMLTVPVERLSKVAASIAEGDLRRRVAVGGSDEIAQLAHSFEAMSEALRLMLGDLRQATAQLDAEAGGMMGMVNHQSQLTSLQASAVDQTNVTVREIAETSAAATRFADGVISSTQRANRYSRDGQAVIAQTVERIDALAQQVSAVAEKIEALTLHTAQIGTAISTIQTIAQRSNLLALNASLEAVKSGEHGRGFALVAREIRSLATESKKAAEEIGVLLREIEQGTGAAVRESNEGLRQAQETVALVRSAGEAIVQLAAVCSDSSDAGEQIAASTRQQTEGVVQIARAMQGLSSAASESVRGTQQVERAAENLRAISSRLTELAARYQT